MFTTNRRHFSSGKEKTEHYRLVKYFTFTSHVVAFIGALTLSVLFAHFMEAINRTKNEDYAKLLITNLNYQVFMNFNLPVVREFGEIHLQKEDQYKLMDTVVRTAVQGSHVEMARIYSPNNIISYSYETSEKGSKNVSSTNFQRALDGKSSYELIQLGSAWRIFLGMPEKVKMVTMAPFRIQNSPLRFVKGKGFALVSKNTQEEGEELVLGVTEIVIDLTEDYRKIIEFQKLMFFSIIGVVAILFIILRWVIKNGETMPSRSAFE